MISFASEFWQSENAKNANKKQFSGFELMII